MSKGRSSGRPMCVKAQPPRRSLAQPESELIREPPSNGSSFPSKSCGKPASDAQEGLRLESHSRSDHLSGKRSRKILLKRAWSQKLHAQFTEAFDRAAARRCLPNPRQLPLTQETLATWAIPLGGPAETAERRDWGRRETDRSARRCCAIVRRAMIINKFTIQDFKSIESVELDAGKRERLHRCERKRQKQSA